MRYTVYFPGLANDSGFSASFAIKSYMFNQAESIATAVFDSTTLVHYAYVFDNELNIYGWYNPEIQLWQGDLRP